MNSGAFSSLVIETPSPICCSISVRVKFCEKIMPKCSCWNNPWDLKIPINIPLKTISWPKFKSVVSPLVWKSDRIWLIELNFHTIGQLNVKVLDQNSFTTQFTRLLKLMESSFQLTLEVLVLYFWPSGELVSEFYFWYQYHGLLSHMTT